MVVCVCGLAALQGPRAGKGGPGKKQVAKGDMLDSMLEALARPMQVSCGGEGRKSEGWFQSMMNWGAEESSSDDTEDEDEDEDDMPTSKDDFM